LKSQLEKTSVVSGQTKRRRTPNIPQIPHVSERRSVIVHGITDYSRSPVQAIEIV